MSVCDGDREQAMLACLPRLDPHTAHLEDVARMLARSGVGARVGQGAMGRAEIRVSLTLDAVELEGSFDLAEWCALRFDGGDCLAFGEIDPAYLLPMLEREANAMLRQLGDLPVSSWRALEVRHSRIAEPRLRLATRVGWPALSLAAWPSARYTRCLRPTSWRAVFDGVPVRLSLLVGRSRVTRRLMRRLMRGDVLLVQCSDWRVRIAHTTLGVFSVSRQEWKMETFEGSPRRDIPLPARGAPSSVEMSMLEDVPMEAEFLLASHTLSLAELRGLHAGATFALAQGYLVEVRINGLPIAQGELVALGDRLAVQIVRLNGEA